MIVVAKGLVPGDSFVEPGRLVFILIIIMRSGDWIILERRNRGYILAVKDIDIPPQFVVLSVVDAIAQRDAEIKGSFLCRAFIVWTAASRT